MNYSHTYFIYIFLSVIQANITEKRNTCILPPVIKIIALHICFLANFFLLILFSLCFLCRPITLKLFFLLSLHLIIHFNFFCIFFFFCTHIYEQTYVLPFLLYTNASPLPFFAIQGKIAYWCFLFCFIFMLSQIA